MRIHIHACTCTCLFNRRARARTTTAAVAATSTLCATTTLSTTTLSATTTMLLSGGMLLFVLTLGVDPLVSQGIVVDLDVNVGLLGFSGEGAWQFELNAGELHSLLERLLPERRPSCGPEATPMGVTYKLNYNVVLMQTGLARLQRTLATAMRPAHADEHGVYDVEASAIEEHFDMLYASYFTPHEQPEGAEGPAAYTILVINPNKGDMAQLADVPPAFSYRYRYNGGAPSQMWLSAHRYLVLDVSAGPCSLGMSRAAGGAVSAASVPQIHAALQGGAAGLKAREADAAAASSHALYHNHVTAQLGGLLLSAVRHVIAADLHACALPDFDELVVPLLALRNHALFDPLQAGHAFSVDLPRLGLQLRKLLLPGQTLTLLPSTHELHGHPQLSVAVTRAMQADSVHEHRGGRHVASARPYIDAEGLAHQLRHTVDWLALPLLDAAAASALRRPSGPDGSSDGSAAAANRTAPGEGRRRRVLPVYVFSLAGLHEELLMASEPDAEPGATSRRDGGSSADRDLQLSHAAADLVIVLQTEQQSLATPHFDDGGAVRTSPRDPTRHVLAGLAAAVGAIPPPYQARLPGGGAVYDFAWATGHHPFGPFANSSALSATTVDAARRNALLSRLHQAHLTLRAAAAALEATAAPYVHATDADSPEHRQQLQRLRAAAVGGGAAHAAAVVAALGEEAGGELQRLLLLRLQRGALRLSSATAQREVLRHFAELCAFDAPLADAARQLQQQRWQAAHAATSALLGRTSAFLEQLQTDLGRLQQELACCATAHAAPPSYHLRSALLLALGAAMLYGATVWLASPSRKKLGHRRQ